MDAQFRSRQDSRGAPVAGKATGASTAARQSQAAARQRHMITYGIWLAALARFMGNRRFASYVIGGALGLVAAIRLSRENQERTFARLIAWDRRQRLIAQRKVKPRQRAGG